MAVKTPLAIVKEKFGDKAKLVDAIEKLAKDGLWLARAAEGKGLAHVSNAKLLRLHATFSTVKEQFGTRDKLVDALLEIEKRGKDTGLRQKISEWPVPRLFDAYRSAKKRAGVAKETPKAAAEANAPKAAKTAKAPAKKAAKAPKT